MQHETADKSIEFFKTTRYYRNACEAYLKDESSSLIRDHVNAIILQSKTQKDEAQKSKNNNSSKKRARKCVCREIHEFDECSYIVSSTRKSD